MRLVSRCRRHVVRRCSRHIDSAAVDVWCDVTLHDAVPIDVWQDAASDAHKRRSTNRRVCRITWPDYEDYSRGFRLQ